MSEFGSVFFCDGATPIMRSLVNLYHIYCYNMIYFLVGISFFITAFVRMAPHQGWCVTFHSQSLEFTWTAIPIAVLISLLLPGYKMVIQMDECVNPLCTVKATGSQWFWSYEYGDYAAPAAMGEKGWDSGVIHPAVGSYSFSQYMKAESDLELGELRNLAVDKLAPFPEGIWVRLLGSSTDVIHSWSVPFFGVKSDVIPGRIIETPMFLDEMGTFSGQCAELCGVNHAFMPIGVEVISHHAFTRLIKP
uniref:Cytochrome c oxidase subunit 2 n=1 Tax=Pteria penguin TaxID=113549 RepID=G9I215_PTEPN|nr:cytochrome oxidase subnunit II [Pteria penguin]